MLLGRSGNANRRRLPAGSVLSVAFPLPRVAGAVGFGSVSTFGFPLPRRGVTTAKSARESLLCFGTAYVFATRPSWA